MYAEAIELAVARELNYRQNIIVPNVFWGLGLRYEADLVCLRPSGYAIEIEIKTTAADIRADLKKRRQHNSDLFRQLWFAVPVELAEHPDIPARAGIYAVVKHEQDWHYVKTIRPARRNLDANRWTAEQRLKLLHLAAMRIWGLKAARYSDRLRREEKEG